MVISEGYQRSSAESFNLDGSGEEDRSLQCLEFVNLTPDSPDRQACS